MQHTKSVKFHTLYIRSYRENESKRKSSERTNFKIKKEFKKQTQKNR